MSSTHTGLQLHDNLVTVITDYSLCLVYSDTHKAILCKFS